MKHDITSTSIAKELLKTTTEYFNHFVIPDDFSKAIQILRSTQGKIHISGLGKSGHIAHLLAATLKSIHIPASFLHAAEALHGDLGILQKHDTLIILSHSGKTHECVSICNFAQSRQIPVIAITSSKHSPLARSSQALLDYAPKELCQWQRTPTISTLTMQLIGNLITMTLLQQSSLTEHDYLLTHEAGSHGLDLTPIQNIYLPLDQIAIIDETTILSHTLQKISQYQLGCALIINHNAQLIGIFTDGDLRRAIIGGITLDDHVLKWSTLTPTTILNTMTVGETKKLFKEKRITSMPVIDKSGATLGLITYHQLETNSCPEF